MSNPLDAVPAHLHDAIRRIWRETVSGGSGRQKKSKDRSGLEGLKAVSQLLKRAGIGEDDSRWRTVTQHGRDLYYGRPTGLATPPVAAPRPVATRPSADSSEGTAYTSGTTFRARAEAHQRRFRAEMLHVGWAKYGHLLDEAAIAAGANFLHPSARRAAEQRAAAGKGVNRERTFGNMLSSQAMGFNLFGPLAFEPDGLDVASDILRPFVPGLARVRSIAMEYTPPHELFRDQSKFGGVDCDVLIEFDAADGEKGVLVIETKFVEESFSRCGHRKSDARDPCPDDVVLGCDHSGCRYVRKNRFAYWQRTAETRSIRLPLVPDRGCPFGGGLWQIWVNHALAHVEAARRGAKHAVFAVCAPSANAELLQNGAILDQFRRLATAPSSVVFVPTELLLDHLVGATSNRGAAWRTWAAQMQMRYAVGRRDEPASDCVPGVEPQPARRNAVTDGHRRCVEWMSTAAFREIVEVHRLAARSRSTVYFRPTAAGVVRIGLHPDAPAYVGFRTHADDPEFLLTVGAPVPSLAAIEARFDAFERWLPTVRRPSDEERGVIPWIRHALEQGLRLDDLGPGWVFLHQEWRFLDDAGVGRKSDVLAVHLPTARLGIIEFKSDRAKLPEARRQVAEYARFWARDATELAPFFTSLLRTMGAAYANAAATSGTVGISDAMLFVGVASKTHGVVVTRA